MPDFTDGAFRRLAADATVLVNARRPIDAGTLAMAPAVRFVQIIGAGTDTLDRAALAAAGVVAAFNPGVNRTGAAEHTLMLMLALIKRLPVSDRATRAGRFAPARSLLAASTISLTPPSGSSAWATSAGPSRNGLRRSEPRIVYHSSRPVPDIDERFGAERLPLAELFQLSNILTLHVPLTPETHHLLGADGDRDDAALGTILSTLAEAGSRRSRPS